LLFHRISELYLDMGNKASVPTAANSGAPASAPAPASAAAAASNTKIPAGLFAANSAASAPLPPVVQAANNKLVRAQNNAARANAALAAQAVTVGELNKRFNLVEPMPPMQGGRKNRKSRKNRKNRKGKSRKNL